MISAKFSRLKNVLKGIEKKASYFPHGYYEPSDKDEATDWVVEYVAYLKMVF
ncbi:hypothetical protein [Mesotoga sp.]|uniref:hypothetical protein n=1 Tax=Mesotoga sp. TaxID=2053577 RepID=UPI00345EAFA7